MCVRVRSIVMCIWRQLRPHSQYVVTSSIRSICAVAVLFAWLTTNFVRVANASDIFNNININPQQPCDRTRRVYTDISGEISDGPVGFNYTQVSCSILWKNLAVSRVQCDSTMWFNFSLVYFCQKNDRTWMYWDVMRFIRYSIVIQLKTYKCK